MRLLLWLAVAILVLALNVEADVIGNLIGEPSSSTSAETKPTPSTESPSPPTQSPTHAPTTQAQPSPEHTETTTHAAPPAPATSAPTSTTAAPVVHTSSSVPVSSSLPIPSSITPLTSTALVSASLNATSASMSATPSSTAASSSDDSSSSNSKPIIIGSICGFVAIIAAGFGYAFLSKTRRNNRKKRVFGADEDDGMDPSIPAPSPFQRHNESLVPAAAAWETDQKRPLGPPSPYADYNYPSPALTQNGVRRSPPVAHTDAYYAQPPAASPYYDDHQQTYDQQTYYEQYPQQPMEMQHVTSPQMHQQYQYYGHNDPYNYRQ